MNVTTGWSGEAASGVWRKASVMVEEIDLMRLLVVRSGNKNGSTDGWGANPDLALAKAADVFTAMSSEADRLLEAGLYQRYERMRTEERKADIAQLTAARNAALDRLLHQTHVPVA